MAAETVEVDIEHAETALRELEALINYTGGFDVGTGEACSPLALVRQRVEREVVCDESVAEAILAIIVEVGEERQMETSDVDPLQDDVFRAKRHLEQVLFDDPPNKVETFMLDHIADEEDAADVGAPIRQIVTETAEEFDWSRACEALNELLYSGRAYMPSKETIRTTDVETTAAPADGGVS